MLLVNTLLPMVAIVIIYVLILKRIDKTVWLVRSGPTVERVGRKDEKFDTRRTTKEYKRTKMTFFIVGTYIVCWGPSLLYYLLLSFCGHSCFNNAYKDSTAEEIVGFLIKFLTFVDGVVAPLVYCWASNAFQELRRKAIKSIRKIIFKEQPVFVAQRKFGRCSAMNKDILGIEAITEHSKGNRNERSVTLSSYVGEECSLESRGVKEDIKDVQPQLHTRQDSSSFEKGSVLWLHTTWL